MFAMDDLALGSTGAAVAAYVELACKHTEHQNTTVLLCILTLIMMAQNKRETISK
jgi:hypothetical protein